MYQQLLPTPNLLLRSHLYPFMYLFLPNIIILHGGRQYDIWFYSPTAFDKYDKSCSILSSIDDNEKGVFNIDTLA